MGTQLAAQLPSFLAQFQTGLTANLPQLIAAGQTMIVGMINGLSAGLPQLLQKGADMISNLVTGAYAALPQVMESAMAVVTSFLQMVISNLPQILQAGTQVISSVVQGIGNAMPQIIASAARMVATLLTTLVQHLPEIVAAGFELLVSLIKGIGDAMPGIVEAAGEAASTIWDTILQIDWPALGCDVVSGLINGLVSMGGALWDAATDLAKSAFDAVAGFFEIRSPSRLMRNKIGHYIPAGLAQGILDKAGLVQSAMRSVSGMAEGTIQSRLSATMQTAGRSVPVRSQSTTETAFLAALQIVADRIIQAIRENGGDLYIGDDVIGRANDRYRADQAMMKGGAY